MRSSIDSSSASSYAEERGGIELLTRARPARPIASLSSALALESPSSPTPKLFFVLRTFSGSGPTLLLRRLITLRPSSSSRVESFGSERSEEVGEDGGE